MRVTTPTRQVFASVEALVCRLSSRKSTRMTGPIMPSRSLIRNLKAEVLEAAATRWQCACSVPVDPALHDVAAGLGYSESESETCHWQWT